MRRLLIVTAVLVVLVPGAAQGVAGPNVIVGTDGDDVIRATSAADVIYARRGDDRILDVGDGDVVWAGTGDDHVSTLSRARNVRIEANVGDDVVDLGGARTSSANGDSGADVITGSGRGNTIVGGTGDDTYRGGGVGNALNLANGNDTVDLVSDRGSTVHLGNGADVLRSRSGRATTITAGSGDDLLQFQAGSPDTTAYLGAGSDEVALDGTCRVTIYGNSGADRIHGRMCRATVSGESGDDLVSLQRRSADNVLAGGNGRDEARLANGTRRTTCSSVERVLDAAGRAARC